jgi:hypothetical protein
MHLHLFNPYNHFFFFLGAALALKRLSGRDFPPLCTHLGAGLVILDLDPYTSYEPSYGTTPRILCSYQNPDEFFWVYQASNHLC